VRRLPMRAAKTQARRASAERAGATHPGMNESWAARRLESAHIGVSRSTRAAHKSGTTEKTAQQAGTI